MGWGKSRGRTGLKYIWIYVRLSWHQRPALWMKHLDQEDGTLLARWAGAALLAGWYYLPAVPPGSPGMSCRQGEVHQTDCVPHFVNQKSKEDRVMCLPQRIESPLLRKVYLQVLFIHS